MYFNNCTTVEQIKAEWRKLCFLHHPNIGGDTATMQEVNDAYHKALKNFHESSSTGTDGKQHTYYYNEDIEQAVMDKISEILAKNLTGIKIWLIGTWVWVDGDTRPVKDTLKELGLRWHGKRKKWYWHNGKNYRRRASNASLNDLAAKYGARGFSSDDKASGLATA